VFFCTVADVCPLPPAAAPPGEKAAIEEEDGAGAGVVAPSKEKPTAEVATGS